VSELSDIPEPVRRFLVQHVDSVGLLDALLLLRAAPDRRWTPQELARTLVTGERLAVDQLGLLAVHGLAVAQDGSYRFNSSCPHALTIDALADCYARRRHTVIGLIYGGGEPGERAAADG
jgi:hypothetical protein